MKREDVIREVQSMLDAGGYQVAKKIVKLADKPEGTFERVADRPSGKRDMSQAEARRIVDEARRRIKVADADD